MGLKWNNKKVFKVYFKASAGKKRSICGHMWFRLQANGFKISVKAGNFTYDLVESLFMKIFVISTKFIKCF